MFSVRTATPDDAPAVAAVLQAVVAERVHSAIDRAWTVEEERAYLISLSSREVVHVAIDDIDGIVGLQVLDRWSTLDSMAHVGQVGTFILPARSVPQVGRHPWRLP